MMGRTISGLIKLAWTEDQVKRRAHSMSDAITEILNSRVKMELIPILIKALQEQQEIIENQTQKIGVQNTKIEQFETSIESLMQRMAQLENK